MALWRQAVLDVAMLGMFAALAAPNATAQHITIDGSLHTAQAQALAGPNYAITASLGKQVGSNLFHSFGIFGLSTGESATFSGPATVNNVIGRVTGGNPSSIDGKIQSAIAGANLYLINPSGIVFGPNATVNVSGSFHASTADYLKMSDGARFQATNPDGSTLSAAPPAAFGFLNAQPAAITVNGSTLGPVPGTLGLVGGPVSVTGGTLSAPAGTIHVASAAGTGEVPVDPRNTVAVTVTSLGPVNITGGSTLDVSDPTGLGSGGSVFIHSGALTINASEINADNYGSGPGGQLVLRGDSQVALMNGANVHAVAMANGGAADIVIATSPAGAVLADNSMVQTGTLATGGGSITITAGQLTLQNGANVLAASYGSGTGGDISTSIGGALTLNSGASLSTLASAAGNGGSITVAAGQLTIQNGANVSAQSSGTGAGGAIAITAASVVLDGGASLDQATGVFSNASSIAGGGSITIVAGQLALQNGANVLAQSFGTGTGGAVSVSVGSTLTVNSGASLGTLANAGGNAGDVTISAGQVAIDMSVGAASSLFQGIASQSIATGDAGNVAVTGKTISIENNGEIESAIGASGKAGDVSVTALDALTIDGSGASTSLANPTGIFSVPAPGSMGGAGNVSVSAKSLSIINGGAIETSTFSSGNAGRIMISVAGQLTIDGSKENLQTGPTGIRADAEPGSSNAAGTVSVSAGSLSISNNGEISATTFVSGNAGSVTVSVLGQLTIDGSAETLAHTGIFSQAQPSSSGGGGSVSVSAGTLSIVSDGEITSSTFGKGKGGDVSVTVAGALSLDRAAGIFSQAEPGSGGAAGDVSVSSDTLSIVKNSEISSSTAASGNGGRVQVTALGPLTLSDPGSGITASATSMASGNAGSVTVTAGSLTIAGGAQIASSTAGTGKGGNVEVAVASDIVLLDRGPQITARSTGSGDAGSITVSAVRLLMNNGAAISSEAATSTANGGNIMLSIGDFLYLVGSEITTSVKGETGNGGNIWIDPQFAVLDHSSIIAQAVEGHGGNIMINAGTFIASADSIVSATSQLGVSGLVTINGPLVDLNGTLVVLSSELRSAVALTREACAARSNRLQSSLVEAGHGGLPQDPEATLPALYIAGRDIGPYRQAHASTTDASAALQTTVRLRMRCGQ